MEDLYTKFQQAIYDVLSLPCPAEKCTFHTVDLQMIAILLKVQQKSGLKNLILEKKIDTVEEASFAWQKMIDTYVRMDLSLLAFPWCVTRPWRQQRPK